MDNRTGQMVPKKDENIYFGGSMGGGLIVDDKKNNVKFIIERDESITWLFSIRKNTHLYDVRDGRIIADRVRRKFGPEHKYCDYRYFVRNMRVVDEGKINEGFLARLTKEYAGELIRKENTITTINGYKFKSGSFGTEKEFIDFVNNLYELLDSEGIIYFDSSIYDHNGEIELKTNDKEYLYILPSFDDVIKYDAYENLSKENYKLFCDFVGFLVKDMEVVYDNKHYISLASESDVQNKFDDTIYEFNSECPDYIYQSCWDELKDTFKDYCNNIIGFNGFYLSDLNFKSFNNYGGVYVLLEPNFDNFIYYKRMRDWWSKQLNELEKIGAKEYFGLDEIDEEE